MARTDQPDLFLGETEPDLFGADTAPAYHAARVNLYRTIFPQMTLWLPEEEAAQLRFEFAAEMTRLEAA